jgi:hypothetical protein
MALALSPAAPYLERYNGKNLACSQYALNRLGLDKSRCILKIDNYMILCAPFQLSFKRAMLIASLSDQEIVFFQRFKNGLAGLSMEFIQSGRTEPTKIFIRSSIAEIGAMKGRFNVGMITIDFKTTPENFIEIVGGYFEAQDRLSALYDELASTAIRITPDTAKGLGYNQYATVTDGAGSRRIQLFTLTSKYLEHLEAAGSVERPRGSAVQYQLFFRKYRVGLSGLVEKASRQPTGIVKTSAQFNFCPELVEILDEYRFLNRGAARVS